MAFLLIVEDNEALLANLYEWFEGEGHQLDCARDGRHALELLYSNTYDCAILDVMLPERDGFSICREIRQMGNQLPVIMLTARDSVEDKVAGLELGADDYLVKPFSLRELNARIQALLRRPSLKSAMLTFGSIIMDLQTHTCKRNGVELRLTPISFKILHTLLRHAPNVVSKETLEKCVWGEEPPGAGSLRNHIMGLRKILDKPFPFAMLETVSHVGYRLRSEES